LNWNNLNKQNNQKATMTGTTGKLERHEGWNNWKAGSTGKLERSESWKSQIDLEQLA